MKYKNLNQLKYIYKVDVFFRLTKNLRLKLYKNELCFI